MYIDHDVAQLLAYPCGKFLAKVLPRRTIKLGKWDFCLNPGPFNQKEYEPHIGNVRFTDSVDTCSSQSLSLTVSYVSEMFHVYSLMCTGRVLFHRYHTSNIRHCAGTFIDSVQAQILPEFFGDNNGRKWGYQLLASLSIQMLGYGAAGISRRFIVYPMQQIWPNLLSTVALNKAHLTPHYFNDSNLLGST